MAEAEEIVKLFEEAISKALRPWSSREKELVLDRVRQVLSLLREGKIGSEDAYYQLVGIAYEHLVPLSPGDLARLRELVRKVKVAVAV